MATQFPAAQDTFTNPTSGNNLNNPSHSGQHADANDAIEAIETKIGTGASTPAATQVLTGTGTGTSGWSGSLPNGIVATTQSAGDNSTKVATTEYADRKVDQTQYNTGWIASEAATYVSLDGSTGIFNIASDVTGKYSPGMRYKYQQSQALTAYWSFDTNSNSDVGSFNGTDTNMTYTAGKFSNAATFNGTTSKIVIADSASLKPTGEFTLGCWFKTSATGAVRAIFSSWSQNTNSAGIQLRINTSNVLEFVSGKNTGATTGVDRTIVSGTTTVTDNAFHYVVASFRNNYLQVYLDGKLEISSYCFTPAYAATNYVRIGCANDTGTDTIFWSGQIDDLFLINGYALDEATIKAQYAAQTAQGTGNITVQKYGLIIAVGAYSGGNTPITIWGGTDYSLQNATILNPYYSTAKEPFGFPISKEKWTIELKDIVARTQSTPTQNVWYNLGNLTIVAPIGKWNLSTNLTLNAYKNSSTYADMYFTVSNANNTEWDYDLTSFVAVSIGGASSVQAISPIMKSKVLNFPVKTTLYLNGKTGATGGVTSIAAQNDKQPLIVRLENAYL